MVVTPNVVLQERIVVMQNVYRQQRLVQCLQQRRRVQFHANEKLNEQPDDQEKILEELARLRSEYQQRQRNR